MIRSVNIKDAAALCGIYNHYIEHSAVTFEETALSPAAMEERIREICRRYPWLVWEAEGRVLGYAYVHRWHERAAYRFTVEDSVYLLPGEEGRGLGKALLERLLEELRKTELHALMSVITLPNPGSVALHEKFGFKKAAHFGEVGYKMGQWLDVGYWELIL
jgi:phosphinothricin acetyltransferase